MGKWKLSNNNGGDGNCGDLLLWISFSPDDNDNNKKRFIY